jgi:hypothetical protein
MINTKAMRDGSVVDQKTPSGSFFSSGGMSLLSIINQLGETDFPINRAFGGKRRYMSGNELERSWGEGNSRFDTTEWTKVHSASLNTVVMGELYQKYRKPVYLFLRGRGFKEHTAKDLVHGFFSEKVLGKQLFSKADPQKGRFRDFLLRSVRNYATDVVRSQHLEIPLQEDHDRPDVNSDPDRLFNQAWISELVSSTLSELEKECDRHGKHKHWKLFHYWLVESHIESNKKDIKALCDQLNIESPNKAYRLIFEAKHRFRGLFRDRLHAYGLTEAEIDEEIQCLLGNLS